MPNPLIPVAKNKAAQMAQGKKVVLNTPPGQTLNPKGKDDAPMSVAPAYKPMVAAANAPAPNPFVGAVASGTPAPPKQWQIQGGYPVPVAPKPVAPVPLQSLLQPPTGAPAGNSGQAPDWLVAPQGTFPQQSQAPALMQPQGAAQHFAEAFGGAPAPAQASPPPAQQASGFGPFASFGQWQQAFAAEHGGRMPNDVDAQDAVASFDYAAQTGSGPTAQDWLRRYYNGKFPGGVDEAGGAYAQATGWNTQIPAMQSQYAPTQSGASLMGGTPNLDLSWLY